MTISFRSLVVGARPLSVGLALLSLMLGSAPGGAADFVPQSPEGSAPVGAPIGRESRVWVKVTAGAHHSCAVRSDGTLWCWGWNMNGQLGVGDRKDRWVPTRAGSNRDWAKIAPGHHHTCAMRTDRSLWCWGRNVEGQLGFGDTRRRVIPTQVGTDLRWRMISTGYRHTCAVRTDRTLWCWGANDYGELGLGDRSGRLVPTQVGTDQDWARVATGVVYTCAVRTDRTLWCWGDNNTGQLGLGDRSDRLVPTQVGTDQDWARIATGSAHTCAVRTDQTLWCWGYNGYGQLGLDDPSVDVLVPTEVGIDHNWVRIAPGGFHTCAVRTDRSLWCWGRNLEGQLGLGFTSTDVSFPTQVGIDQDWAQIAAGLVHTCAVRIDRSLWCWGENGFGQLGLGDTIDRLVPRRV